MNQVAQFSAVSRSNAAVRPATAGGPCPVAEAQARQLDASLLAFAREVLTHDDAASEMPLRQFRVCMELVAGAQSMSALSRELGVSLSAMTQIANRLERAGLVTRGFEDTDRRVRQLRLTPRARRMLRMRQESRISRIAAVLGRMSPAARANALAAIEELRVAALVLSPCATDRLESTREEERPPAHQTPSRSPA
jgi:DNA-binding MarR family transcriptional regulator